MVVEAIIMVEATSLMTTEIMAVGVVVSKIREEENKGKLDFE